MGGSYIGAGQEYLRASCCMLYGMQFWSVVVCITAHRTHTNAQRAAQVLARHRVRLILQFWSSSRAQPRPSRLLAGLVPPIRHTGVPPLSLYAACC